jgi:hypothetical protein
MVTTGDGLSFVLLPPRHAPLPLAPIIGTALGSLQSSHEVSGSIALLRDKNLSLTHASQLATRHQTQKEKIEEADNEEQHGGAVRDCEWIGPGNRLVRLGSL